MPSVLQRVYANRGINHVDELDLSVKGLLHFNQLTDCEKAAERIGQAIIAGESICICGDFDADGATSVALLMSFFRSINHSKAFYLVPNRFSDGYGLSPTLAQYAHTEGANLLITVDNGISSHAGVSKANDLGMQVIITDHHLPSTELPDAFAVVNPNRRDCAFASKQLAGVGVAFYLLLALRAWFKQQQANHAVASLKIAEYLDLVALGTVADVVPLDYNNRILVRQGLARIREGVCRPGITALLAVARREASKITASDLGFSVGPRINAAGRLDDIQQGIECLLAQDLPSAQILALRLDELNQQRRKIETTMQEEAQACLARLQVDEQELPLVLTVFDDQFHQGVIGIVAGRLKEQFYRPVMVFAEADDGTLKGSCRSVAGVHIRDLLEQVASEFPDVISKFGGHAMAAGLSVPKSQWAAFNRAVQQVAERWVDADTLARVLWSDGELQANEFNLDVAGALQQAGPWGQSFPQPMFDGTFKIIQEKWLKDVHLKLVVQPFGSNETFDAIAFNVPRASWQWNSPAQANLVFKLDVNEFRGQRNVQLLIEHVQA
ncbi:single-stranded-DNA-specific exonuclease RecJ [Aliidiomarina shirensis]|uniref:Single-stranded-DNA-specific exonuclease RecJ n=2 Tax=Aliidiomarina shirensis TaxID=1048642 RepID=A0A432WYK0_9GAMM|nr:single-stranded-DNA-specific exonuclease RecJ [Aliidiomarina shirensis]